MTSQGKVFRVGSRKSQLAMIQTNLIVNQLKEIHPHHSFEIVGISTIGDKILDVALSKIGEKSLFTKELEVALLDSQVDFVVHSLKDLPTTLPEGLTIAAIPRREDPRDAVILSRNKEVPVSGITSLLELHKGSVVGTSSPRRIAQLRNKYPHLEFTDIRGNLNTRLRKLDDPSLSYTAILLAIAGVHRMGWDDRISLPLDPEDWKYAVGQGALGVECASSNEEVIELLQPLNDPVTYLSCVAERNFLRALEGGCAVPVGVQSVLSQHDSPNLQIAGVVYNLDGTKVVNVQRSSNLLEVGADFSGACDMTSIIMRSFPSFHPKACFVAARLGRLLGDDALNHGAKEVMEEVRLVKTGL